MLLNFTSVQTDALNSAKIDQHLSSLTSLNTNELLSSLMGVAISLAMKVLIAIIIFSIGAWLIKKTKRLTEKMMHKKDVEQSLRGFIISFISISLNILLILTIIGILGINTTSFAALLAAGGVAVGMALSGTLQNFAGGVMILLFKPFKVGDFVEAQGYMGTIQEIRITNTFMTTPDNKMIIVPNGPLSNGIINNFSRTGVRRVDWRIELSYGDDLQKAKELILNMLNEDSRVLKEPAEPFAALDKMGESAIVIVARAWVKTEDFWSLYFKINEDIYTKYPENGFRFVFPQLDVNIKKS
ncbi:MAG: mechanosensitive ion channel domain-containing protein [Bacteroidales bacterium]